MSEENEKTSYECPRLRPVEAFASQIQGQPVVCLRDPMGYSESVVCVPHETASILGLFDGHHSLLDIQEAFTRSFGSLLFREQLLGVIRSLDEHLLLDSPRFDRHREAIEEEFRSAPHRSARLAGKAYASDPAALRQELDGYFSADGGPGSTPPSPSAPQLVGLVVPHIDFRRGGTCYAWGYREVAGAEATDRWIILGTVHAPIARAFALTRKHFETPLGLVQTDCEFVEQLLARAGHQYLDDESAHRVEHSIEFQTIFMRHVTPSGRSLAIVPILCGSYHPCVEDRRSPTQEQGVAGFLSALGETIAAVGGRTLVIASADLAHVGPQFGDPRPITPGQLREVADADREMLSVVESADAEGFFREVTRDGDRRRICGLPPIYAALRVLPGAWGRLLQYGQWPDPQGTVTFASVGLYK